MTKQPIYNTLSNSPYEKCIGCGYCCVKAPCVASVRLYKESRPCPALVWDEDTKRHWCELGLLPGVLGEEYRKELYMNQGCCMNLNSWRKDPLQDRTKTLPSDILTSPIPVIMQIFLKCLGNEPFVSADLLNLVTSNFESELTKHKFDPETAKTYHRWCSKYIFDNRNAIFKDFMG